MKWDKLADGKKLTKAADALEKNGFKVFVVQNRQEAFQKALELIPAGAEVMDLTSTTLDQIGLSKEIQESGKFSSVRKKIMSVDQKELRSAMRRMSSAVEYAIGSVHAVTQKGEVIIASNSGSQLAPYAYGAGKLVWIVGAQKIVKNLDEAFKRVYQHSFPLEDERAKKAYGMPSGVNKLLIVNKEIMPDRISIIFVKEHLGF